MSIPHEDVPVEQHDPEFERALEDSVERWSETLEILADQ